MSNLEAALTYATLGWNVFPLHTMVNGKCSCRDVKCKNQGKHPLAQLAPQGFKQATTDKARIQRWWRSRPDANVGIATGSGSDLFVVDVDFGSGGQESMEELAQEYGWLRTCTVRTGGGGLHLYYNHVDGLFNSQSKLGEGIDTRGEGGYVIAPPSLHRTGRKYEWVLPPKDQALSQCPEWVVTVCRRDSEVDDKDWKPPRTTAMTDAYSRAEKYLDRMEGAVSGSGGHQQTFRAALAMVRGFALSEDDALVLMQTFNGKCEPKWSDKELEHKVRSAMNAGGVPVGYLYDSAPRNGVPPPLTSAKPKEAPVRAVPPKKEKNKRLKNKEHGLTSQRTSSSPLASSSAPDSDSLQSLSSEQSYDPAADKSKLIGAGDRWHLDKNGIHKNIANGKRTVCMTPIWVEGILTEDGTNLHFAAIKWRTGLGKLHRKIIPLDHISSKAKLLTYAQNGIHVTSENSKHVVDYLTTFFHRSAAHLPHSHAKTSTGWFKRNAFLWGRYVITSKGIREETDRNPEKWESNSVMLSLRDPEMDRLVASFKPCGDMGEWLEAAKEAVFTPEMKAMMLASLGAPILEVLSWEGTNIQNFILDLAGMTSTGKTTALRLAASVWGDPGDGADDGSDPIVGTWGSTLSYLERVSSIRNCLPVMLDDTKRARPGAIPKTVYMMANGQGEGRATITGLQEKRKFRTILLSTGESAATSASEDGGTRVRAIILHGAPFGRSSKEKAELIANLMRTIAQNYGLAGPKFIKWVLGNKHHLSSWIERYENLVTMHRESAGESGPLNRAASIFAFIDLIEGMADQAGVLPWEPDDHSVITQLWDDLASQVEDADRSVDALDYVIGKAASLRHHFWANGVKTGSPPGGWLGRWDDDKRIVGNGRGFGHVGVVKHILKEWLDHHKFDTDALTRQWSVTGILTRDGSDKLTKNVKLGSSQARMYCFNLSLFEVHNEADSYPDDSKACT